MSRVYASQLMAANLQREYRQPSSYGSISPNENHEQSPNSKGKTNITHNNTSLAINDDDNGSRNDNSKNNNSSKVNSSKVNSNENNKCNKLTLLIDGIKSSSFWPWHIFYLLSSLSFLVLDAYMPHSTLLPLLVLTTIFQICVWEWPYDFKLNKSSEIIEMKLHSLKSNSAIELDLISVKNTEAKESGRIEESESIEESKRIEKVKRIKEIRHNRNRIVYVVLISCIVYLIICDNVRHLLTAPITNTESLDRILKQTSRNNISSDGDEINDDNNNDNYDEINTNLQIASMSLFFTHFVLFGFYTLTRLANLNFD